MTEISIDVIEPIQFDITIPDSQADLEINPADVVGIVVVPGQGGPPGPPGDNTDIIGETPAGAQDGVNDVFTTAYPYVAGSTRLVRNGLREYLGLHYTESAASTITLFVAPDSLDDIRIDYLVGAS